MGVLLESGLQLEVQISFELLISAFNQIWVIVLLYLFLEKHDLSIAITSRLDYCTVLFVGLPLRMGWILQLVTVWQWLGAEYRSFISSLLKVLATNLLPGFNSKS